MLPSGFALPKIPEDAKLKWEGNAAFELRTKVEGSSITDARVFARAFTILDAKDYGQLHDFYQKVVAADQQPLVLAGEQVGEVQ